MSFDPRPFDLLGTCAVWLLVVVVMTGIASLFTVIVTLIAEGDKAPRFLAQRLSDIVNDWRHLSPRRTLAVTHLTILETVRKSFLMVLCVFAGLFMFGGWFLTSASQNPQLQMTAYVSFVLRVISWIILPIAGIMACMLVPDDIKRRSIHTVVTKPARRQEIVLGRILGIVAVAGGVLALMGVIGYFWLTHQLPPEAREYLTGRMPLYGEIGFKSAEGVDARAGINVGDEWDFRSFVEGNTRARAIWDFENIPTSLLGDDLRLESGFQVFRTHKGNIEDGVLCQFTFVNEFVELTLGGTIERGDKFVISKEGQPLEVAAPSDKLEETAQAIAASLNKGDRPAFRDVSAIAKGPSVRVRMKRLGKPLLLEVKTTEGDGAVADGQIVTTVDRKLRGLGETFQVREFRINVHDQNRSLLSETGGASLDLIDDIIHDGRLRIEARCLSSQQLLGMARPDLFVRLPDHSFASSYFRCLLGIGLMMVLVTVLGVVASCFVKVPVAITTVSTVVIVARVMRGFMDELANNKVLGGGAIESFYRMATQLNATVKLQDSLGVRIMQQIDGVLNQVLNLTRFLLPDLSMFDRMQEFPARGYEVPWQESLLPCLAMTMGYILPWIFLGYLTLRFRELESK